MTVQLNSFSMACLVACAMVHLGCERRETPLEEETRGDEASREALVKSWVERKPLRLRSWPDPGQLHEFDEHDPAYAVIESYAATIKQRHSEKGVCEIVIDYSKEVKAPASRQLFPDYRFFGCKWSEKIDESQPANVRCSANTVVDALTLDKDLKLTLIGPGHRHDQNFGEFLAEKKVRIVDEKSARLVWDAFCEIRRWHSKSETIEKVSDRVWRLGVKDDRVRGGGKAYHEVCLNEDLTVKSMEHTIEDANGKRWK